MRPHTSAAERLDLAVASVLDGTPAGAAAASAGLERDARSLVSVAAALRGALAVPLPAPRFEARLGTRLAGAGERMDALSWALRHPRGLMVTGAVSSAVGVGVTAYAVWRSNRRTSVAGRLLSR